MIRRFLKNQRGTSSLEYSLLAAIIALGMYAVIGAPTGLAVSLQVALGGVAAVLSPA